MGSRLSDGTVIQLSVQVKGISFLEGVVHFQLFRSISMMAQDYATSFREYRGLKCSADSGTHAWAWRLRNGGGAEPAGVGGFRCVCRCGVRLRGDHICEE